MSRLALYFEMQSALPSISPFHQLECTILSCDGLAHISLSQGNEEVCCYLLFNE